MYNQLCVGKEIEITEGYSEKYGTFAFRKITSVPSKKKGIDFYTIEYDKAHEKLSIYSTKAPGIQKMKSFLKRAIAHTDERGYRYTTDVKKKKKCKRQKKKRKETVIESPGNIILSGLLAELDKEASKKHNTDGMSTSKGSDGDFSLSYSGIF